jgi:hypothetical protein
MLNTIARIEDVMKFSIGLAGLFLLPFLLFIACDEADDCDGKRLKITLAGEIAYEDYESGPIRIYVYEEQSNRCGENGKLSSQTPGEMIGEQELEAPGPFEMEVIVEWVGAEKPGLHILVYNDSDEEDQCKAGGMETVSAMVQDDIEIELVTDDCPALE